MGFVEEGSEEGIDQDLFVAFLLLRRLAEKECKSKNKDVGDLQFCYRNYCRLMADRRSYLECERKLRSLNNFYGLR